MRKDLIGLGSAMFVWFVVLVVVQLSPSVDVETGVFVLAFWSVPVFSIITLILGVVPEKKSSGTESNRPKSAT